MPKAEKKEFSELTTSVVNKLSHGRINREASVASHTTLRSVDRMAASKLQDDDSSESLSDSYASPPNERRVKPRHSSSYTISALKPAPSQTSLRSSAGVQQQTRTESSVPSNKERKKRDSADLWRASDVYETQQSKQSDGAHRSSSRPSSSAAEQARKESTRVPPLRPSASQLSATSDLSQRVAKTTKSASKSFHSDVERAIAEVNRAARASLKGFPQSASQGVVSSLSPQASIQDILRQASRVSVTSSRPEQPDRLKYARDWVQNISLDPPSKVSSAFNIGSEPSGYSGTGPVPRTGKSRGESRGKRANSSISKERRADEGDASNEERPSRDSDRRRGAPLSELRRDRNPDCEVSAVSSTGQPSVKAAHFDTLVSSSGVDGFRRHRHSGVESRVSKERHVPSRPRDNSTFQDEEDGSDPQAIHEQNRKRLSRQSNGGGNQREGKSQVKYRPEVGQEDSQLSVNGPSTVAGILQEASTEADSIASSAATSKLLVSREDLMSIVMHVIQSYSPNPVPADIHASIAPFAIPFGLDVAGASETFRCDGDAVRTERSAAGAEGEDVDGEDAEEEERIDPSSGPTIVTVVGGAVDTLSSGVAKKTVEAEIPDEAALPFEGESPVSPEEAEKSEFHANEAGAPPEERHLAPGSIPHGGNDEAEGTARGEDRSSNRRASPPRGTSKSVAKHLSRSSTAQQDFLSNLPAAPQTPESQATGQTVYRPSFRETDTPRSAAAFYRGEDPVFRDRRDPGRSPVYSDSGSVNQDTMHSLIVSEQGTQIIGEPEVNASGSGGSGVAAFVVTEGRRAAAAAAGQLAVEPSGTSSVAASPNIFLTAEMVQQLLPELSRISGSRATFDDAASCDTSTLLQRAVTDAESASVLISSLEIAQQALNRRLQAEEDQPSKSVLDELPFQQVLQYIQERLRGFARPEELARSFGFDLTGSFGESRVSLFSTTTDVDQPPDAAAELAVEDVPRAEGEDGPDAVPSPASDLDEDLDAESAEPQENEADEDMEFSSVDGQANHANECVEKMEATREPVAGHVMVSGEEIATIIAAAVHPPPDQQRADSLADLVYSTIAEGTTDTAFEAAAEVSDVIANGADTVVAETVAVAVLEASEVLSTSIIITSPDQDPESADFSSELPAPESKSDIFETTVLAAEAADVVRDILDTEHSDSDIVPFLVSDPGETRESAIENISAAFIHAAIAIAVRAVESAAASEESVQSAQDQKSIETANKKEEEEAPSSTSIESAGPSTTSFHEEPVSPFSKNPVLLKQPSSAEVIVIDAVVEPPASAEATAETSFEAPWAEDFTERTEIGDFLAETAASSEAPAWADVAHSSLLDTVPPSAVDSVLSVVADGPSQPGYLSNGSSYSHVTFAPERYGNAAVAAVQFLAAKLGCEMGPLSELELREAEMVEENIEMMRQWTTVQTGMDAEAAVAAAAAALGQDREGGPTPQGGAGQPGQDSDDQDFDEAAEAEEETVASDANGRQDFATPVRPSGCLDGKEVGEAGDKFGHEQRLSSGSGPSRSAPVLRALVVEPEELPASFGSPVLPEGVNKVALGAEGGIREGLEDDNDKEFKDNHDMMCGHESMGGEILDFFLTRAIAENVEEASDREDLQPCASEVSMASAVTYVPAFTAMQRFLGFFPAPSSPGLDRQASYGSPQLRGGRQLLNTPSSLRRLSAEPSAASSVSVAAPQGASSPVFASIRDLLVSGNSTFYSPTRLASDALHGESPREPARSGRTAGSPLAFVRPGVGVVAQLFSSPSRTTVGERPVSTEDERLELKETDGAVAEDADDEEPVQPTQPTLVAMVGEDEEDICARIPLAALSQALGGEERLVDSPQVRVSLLVDGEGSSGVISLRFDHQIQDDALLDATLEVVVEDTELGVLSTPGSAPRIPGVAAFPGALKPRTPDASSAAPGVGADPASKVKSATKEQSSTTAFFSPPVLGPSSALDMATQVRQAARLLLLYMRWATEGDPSHLAALTIMEPILGRLAELPVDIAPDMVAEASQLMDVAVEALSRDPSAFTISGVAAGPFGVGASSSAMLLDAAGVGSSAWPGCSQPLEGHDNFSKNEAAPTGTERFSPLQEDSRRSLDALTRDEQEIAACLRGEILGSVEAALREVVSLVSMQQRKQQDEERDPREPDQGTVSEVRASQSPKSSPPEQATKLANSTSSPEPSGFVASPAHAHVHMAADEPGTPVPAPGSGISAGRCRGSVNLPGPPESGMSVSMMTPWSATTTALDPASVLRREKSLSDMPSGGGLKHALAHLSKSFTHREEHPAVGNKSGSQHFITLTLEDLEGLLFDGAALSNAEHGATEDVVGARLRQMFEMHTPVGGTSSYCASSVDSEPAAAMDSVPQTVVKPAAAAGERSGLLRQRSQFGAVEDPSAEGGAGLQQIWNLFDKSLQGLRNTLSAAPSAFSSFVEVSCPLSLVSVMVPRSLEEGLNAEGMTAATITREADARAHGHGEAPVEEPTGLWDEPSRPQIEDNPIIVGYEETGLVLAEVSVGKPAEVEKAAAEVAAVVRLLQLPESTASVSELPLAPTGTQQLPLDPSSAEKGREPRLMEDVSLDVEIAPSDSAEGQLGIDSASAPGEADPLKVHDVEAFVEKGRDTEVVQKADSQEVIVVKKMTDNLHGVMLASSEVEVKPVSGANKAMTKGDDVSSRVAYQPTTEPEEEAEKVTDEKITAQQLTYPASSTEEDGTVLIGPQLEEEVSSEDVGVVLINDLHVVGLNGAAVLDLSSPGTREQLVARDAVKALDALGDIGEGDFSCVSGLRAIDAALEVIAIPLCGVMGPPELNPSVPVLLQLQQELIQKRCELEEQLLLQFGPEFLINIRDPGAAGDNASGGGAADSYVGPWRGAFTAIDDGTGSCVDDSRSAFGPPDPDVMSRIEMLLAQAYQLMEQVGLDTDVSAGPPRVEQTCLEDAEYHHHQLVYPPGAEDPKPLEDFEQAEDRDLDALLLGQTSEGHLLDQDEVRLDVIQLTAGQEVEPEDFREETASVEVEAEAAAAADIAREAEVEAEAEASGHVPASEVVLASVRLLKEEAETKREEFPTLKIATVTDTPAAGEDDGVENSAPETSALPTPAVSPLAASRLLSTMFEASQQFTSYEERKVADRLLSAVLDAHASEVLGQPLSVIVASSTPVGRTAELRDDSHSDISSYDTAPTAAEASGSVLQLQPLPPIVIDEATSAAGVSSPPVNVSETDIAIPASHPTTPARATPTTSASYLSLLSASGFEANGPVAAGSPGIIIISPVSVVSGVASALPSTPYNQGDLDVHERPSPAASLPQVYGALLVGATPVTPVSAVVDGVRTSSSARLQVSALDDSISDVIQQLNEAAEHLEERQHIQAARHDNAAGAAAEVLLSPHESEGSRGASIPNERSVLAIPLISLDETSVSLSSNYANVSSPKKQEDGRQTLASLQQERNSLLQSSLQHIHDLRMTATPAASSVTDGKPVENAPPQPATDAFLASTLARDLLNSPPAKVERKSRSHDGASDAPPSAAEESFFSPDSRASHTVYLPLPISAANGVLQLATGDATTPAKGEELESSSLICSTLPVPDETIPVAPLATFDVTVNVSSGGCHNMPVVANMAKEPAEILVEDDDKDTAADVTYVPGELALVPTETGPNVLVAETLLTPLPLATEGAPEVAVESVAENFPPGDDAASAAGDDSHVVKKLVYNDQDVIAVASDVLELPAGCLAHAPTPAGRDRRDEGEKRQSLSGNDHLADTKLSVRNLIFLSNPAGEGASDDARSATQLVKGMLRSGGVSGMIALGRPLDENLIYEDEEAARHLDRQLEELDEEDPVMLRAIEEILLSAVPTEVLLGSSRASSMASSYRSLASSIMQRVNSIGRPSPVSRSVSRAGSVYAGSAVSHQPSVYEMLGLGRRPPASSTYPSPFGHAPEPLSLPVAVPGLHSPPPDTIAPQAPQEPEDVSGNVAKTRNASVPGLGGDEGGSASAPPLLSTIPAADVQPTGVAGVVSEQAIVQRNDVTAGEDDSVHTPALELVESEASVSVVSRATTATSRTKFLVPSAPKSTASSVAFGRSAASSSHTSIRRYVRASVDGHAVVPAAVSRSLPRGEVSAAHPEQKSRYVSEPSAASDTSVTRTAVAAAPAEEEGVPKLSEASDVLLPEASWTAQPESSRLSETLDFSGDLSSLISAGRQTPDPPANPPTRPARPNPRRGTSSAVARVPAKIDSAANPASTSIAATASSARRMAASSGEVRSHDRQEAHSSPSLSVSAGRNAPAVTQRGQASSGHRGLGTTTIAPEKGGLPLASPSKPAGSRRSTSAASGSGIVAAAIRRLEEENARQRQSTLGKKQPQPPAESKHLEEDTCVSVLADDVGEVREAMPMSSADVSADLPSSLMPVPPIQSKPSTPPVKPASHLLSPSSTPENPVEEGEGAKDFSVAKASASMASSPAPKRASPASSPQSCRARQAQSAASPVVPASRPSRLQQQGAVAPRQATTGGTPTLAQRNSHNANGNVALSFGGPSRDSSRAATAAAAAVHVNRSPKPAVRGLAAPANPNATSFGAKKSATTTVTNRGFAAELPRSLHTTGGFGSVLLGGDQLGMVPASTSADPLRAGSLRDSTAMSSVSALSMVAQKNVELYLDGAEAMAAPPAEPPFLLGSEASLSAMNSVPTELYESLGPSISMVSLFAPGQGATPPTPPSRMSPTRGTLRPIQEPEEVLIQDNGKTPTEKTS